MSFSTKEIYEMLNKNEVKPLEDILDIEQASLAVKKMNDKIDFYKKLKKRRVEILDNEIKNLADKVDFIRQVILETLKENDEKTLTFPGVCKVGDRKGKDKYIIRDEDKIKEFLKKEGRFEDCVKTTVNEKIISKEVNKLFKDLDKSGKLPDTVEKEEATSNLQLTFEKEISKDFLDDNNDNDVSIEDYDGIGF